MPADTSVPAEKLPVPHAVMWSGEITTQRGLTVRPDGSGLCYQDETRADRDKHGVLWARVHQAPGEGRPNYRALHSVRQRRAMHGMLCQVCGGPASRTSRGWLFLLQRSDAPQDGTDWPEGSLSTKPPICEPCAGLALRFCPHLTDPIAVRSRKPTVWGVYGDFYLPNGGKLACLPSDGHMPYGHPRAARWFLASHLVIELTRCTRVELPRPSCGR